MSEIGKLMKVDWTTNKHEKLQFARVVGEIQIDKKLTDLISFINEHDKVVPVEMVHEWRHVVCEICQGMRHEPKDCDKQSKKVWMPKVNQPVVQVNAETIEVIEEQENEVDQEFRQVRNPARRILTSPRPTNTQNAYDVLNDQVAVVVVGEVECSQKEAGKLGGCHPPKDHG